MSLPNENVEEFTRKIAQREAEICAVGLGRIGLPLACLYAKAGFKVLGVDTNPETVKKVEAGQAPFSEPGLAEMLEKSVKAGRLTASRSLEECVGKSDVILITVPTSVDRRKPDYSALTKAAYGVAKGLGRSAFIMVQSTAGPGTTEAAVADTIEKHSTLKRGEDFALAYSPIRAASGQVLRDLTVYPRVVAGFDDKSVEYARAVISAINPTPSIRVGSIRAAEAVKLFENIYRDVNIALANELAQFCEENDLDYYEVSAAANTQPYAHLHRPGIVGGKCIPVNPFFLIYDAETHGSTLSLVKLARRINEAVANRVARLVRLKIRETGKTLASARITILGASFKANVAEDHLSPAKFLYEALRRKAGDVKVCDPHFSSSELKAFGFKATSSLDEALDSSDCLIVAVGHEEFRRLKEKLAKRARKRKQVVVDCSGLALFTPADSDENLSCTCLGVGSQLPD